MGSLLAVVGFCIAVFLVLGALGFCKLCEQFTNEWEHGRFEGGFKYVADEEHDADGKPLTGWRLEFSRRAEQVFFPLCKPLNKLRGIEKGPPQ